MPNRENIAKWVAALRSGEYQQTKGHLHKIGVGHCCLGVACEVAAKDGANVTGSTMDWSASEGADTYQVMRYNNEAGYLPANVREWLGLDSSNPTIADGIGATDANDDRGWDFSQIADAISERYLVTADA